MKVICRVPVRINLANGGDTDYYIKEAGWGCVVNATLSSHFYEVELNEDNNFKMDIVDYFDYAHNMNRTYKLDSDFSELDLLKASLKETGFNGRNSFVSRTNVPMQSGLGGSSSVCVAILSAIKHYRNEQISPHEIASMAYSIERNRLNVPGGYQDQYAAAFGAGFNYMEFRNDGVSVENLNLSDEVIEKLEKNLVLYYISKRSVSGTEVHKAQEQKAALEWEQVKSLLIQKRENAVKIKAALLSGDLSQFASLLKIDGELKNKLSPKASNEFIDSLMEIAYSNGAIGGKISGAGSGGCMFFYVPEEKQLQFKQAMDNSGAIEMNYRFQRSYEPGILLKKL